MNYIEVFSNLGFTFDTNLKQKDIDFGKNSTLTNKLKNSVFFFKNLNNTSTSFYLFTVNLDDSEIEEVRKYVWNKNDADLIFYYSAENSKLEMLYAKYSPKVKYNESILDTFSISSTQKDLDKIEKIKHWQFDSGVFWLNYYSFISKVKYKGIDKELIATLKSLKEQLNASLSKLNLEKKQCEEIVQALIDRTLYIKFLEDNHIINSHFYGHYFKDTSLNYERLLENNSTADLNKLFKTIHEIFNNALFDQPSIDNRFLTEEIRSLIATSFKANLNTGQLRLYDFQFDVLPVEFISYIYEVFLSDKQKANGIYYTPKKLAQLIIDEVINEDKIGSILDPASGSGMFLIVGYQRLLEIAQQQGLEPQNDIEKIKFRTKFLSENIFGIEKELTAQRFTLFSLSLQIFTGIDANVIKEFIAKELKQNKKINLFSEYSFFDNIKNANTLDISNKSFENKSFLYIVGNPPFFEIPNTDEYSNEISFLNSYKVVLPNKDEISARNIVENAQISQCFFLKIKDWSTKDTRFGFVSNSSNFYYSENFQKYFYSNYGVEKIYELSRVKKILFEKAKESVVVIVFTNEYKNNIIDYYPVYLGLFSEKPFELLIIEEDKGIKLKQKRLVDNEIKLRDYLVGNQEDSKLINSIKTNSVTINNFIKKRNKNKLFIHTGLQIAGVDVILKDAGITRAEYNLNKKQYLEIYTNKYTRVQKNKEFNIPLISSQNIKNFLIQEINCFVNNISNFRRKGYSEDIYEGSRILWVRIGQNLRAVYTDKKAYFDFDVHVVKLEDLNLYFLFTAILNSNLVNYYINLALRKRVFDFHSKIDKTDFCNIPIPKELDQNLLTQISNISKELTEGKYEYSEKENELNELIFDLYELSYWERQRIKDYFLPKTKIERNKKILDNYKSTIKEVISFYLENDIDIEVTSTDFNLIVVKISLNNNFDTPKAEKTKRYILNEIFEQNPNNNFLASQEKIYGKNCIYIIKENINKNWTETKAFEDGQDILNHLMPIGNE